MRALVLALLLPGLAQAQVVTPCDEAGYIASPANLAEPWDTHSRTYANGAIRVALLDTGGEPVCCAAHLLVMSPSGGEDGPEYRACRVISGGNGMGFFFIDIPGITASYDPARGLLLSVPVDHYHPGVEEGRPAIAERMEVRIDQARGTVEVE